MHLHLFYKFIFGVLCVNITAKSMPLYKYQSHSQWRIQDFSDGWVTGRQPIIWPHFSRKLYENERNLNERCTALAPSPTWIRQHQRNIFLHNKKLVIIHIYLHQDKSLSHKLRCKTKFYIGLSIYSRLTLTRYVSSSSIMSSCISSTACSSTTPSRYVLTGVHPPLLC